MRTGNSPSFRARKPNSSSAHISAARAYRHKYGFGLNWEQEVAKNVGGVSRLGWSDGHNETMTFTDADWSAPLGVSFKGAAWRRPDDTFGLAAWLAAFRAPTREFWGLAERTLSMATER
jgi:Carbohydrate-selective porin, OprB family